MDSPHQEPSGNRIQLSTNEIPNDTDYSTHNYSAEPWKTCAGHRDQ